MIVCVHKHHLGMAFFIEILMLKKLETSRYLKSSKYPLECQFEQNRLLPCLHEQNNHRLITFRTIPISSLHKSDKYLDMPANSQVFSSVLCKFLLFLPKMGYPSILNKDQLIRTNQPTFRHSLEHSPPKIPKDRPTVAKTETSPHLLERLLDELITPLPQRQHPLPQYETNLTRAQCEGYPKRSCNRNTINLMMDPRPYHFEYRRPRLYNPTFQSSHLYDSIYQLRSNNNQRNPEQRNNKSVSLTDTELKRANSTDLGSNKTLVELENIGTYRYNSKGNLEQPGKVNQSKMANYGTNLIRNTSMDQTQVYKKQEKEFNIISFYPKEYKPNLRQYPRLTLEDKLIEQKES